jgi:hypothetical protein
LALAVMTFLFRPVDVELVAPVLAKNSGNVTLTAAELGIDSARLRAYVRAKLEMVAVQTEAKEQLVDQAEKAVRTALNCRDTQLKDRATRFVVLRRRKCRRVGGFEKYTQADVSLPGAPG